MTPAKEVGGDFYDFAMLDDHHALAIVADVSGKGVPAALFMAMGTTLLRDHIALMLRSSTSLVPGAAGWDPGPSAAARGPSSCRGS